MKNRREIEEDVKTFCENLRQPGYQNSFGLDKAKAMEYNALLLQKYAEENDLWDEFCWGADESVIYVCMFVSMEVGLKSAETIKDPKAFYDFIKQWFRENAEYYRSLEVREIKHGVDTGTKMARACANIIIESFKREENENPE